MNNQLGAGFNVPVDAYMPLWEALAIAVLIASLV